MENTERKFVRRDYYLLGIRTFKTKEGKDVGLIDLQSDTYYSDGSHNYSIDNSFVDPAKALELMAKDIPARTKVTLAFEEITSLMAKPRIADINIAV